MLAHAQERWDITPPGPGNPRLVHQAFEYGVLACALRESAAHHDDCTVVAHEQLCTEPVAEFRALATTLGLEWTDAATGYLTKSDTEGTGYQTNRRAVDQPDRWRERLDAEQVAIIRATLERFPPSLMPPVES